MNTADLKRKNFIAQRLGGRVNIRAFKKPYMLVTIANFAWPFMIINVTIPGHFVSAMG